MGIEYIAKVPENFRQVDLENMLEEISKSYSEWRLLPKLQGRENTIRIEFSDVSNDPSWPDDINLSILPEGIHVVFYIGTHDQRSQFLKTLEEYLYRSGHYAFFQEI